ncbi:hypothetical protein [Streptomyces sp. NPDC048590]|uniref:hypothetical protein n=1 Tax=Streptomyces sp. NPDC048590 TaxID=3365574 RepID=UPI0037238EEC
MSSVVADAFAPPVSRTPILLKVSGIALIANGLDPRTLWRTLRSGVRLYALRGGPLDKKGSGAASSTSRAGPTSISSTDSTSSPPIFTTPGRESPSAASASRSSAP